MVLRYLTGSSLKPPGPAWVGLAWPQSRRRDRCACGVLHRVHRNRYTSSTHLHQHPRIRTLDQLANEWIWCVASLLWSWSLHRIFCLSSASRSSGRQLPPSWSAHRFCHRGLRDNLLGLRDSCAASCLTLASRCHHKLKRQNCKLSRYQGFYYWHSKIELLDLWCLIDGHP